MRFNTGLENNTIMQTVCLDGLGEITENAPSCLPPAKSEVAMVTSRPPSDHKDNEKDLWSSENVAQAPT